MRYKLLAFREQESLTGVGFLHLGRESGAVRPVANLITGQAHRGSRERCDPWRI
ncbi:MULTISPECIES: hypothetical protein [Moorena]|uniref:Uncharacterized protein n=1 Tax=Moorena producens (strain JHB) TaxID=1454205 RepID=A0A9Q9ST18_MOOP1|nr:MULTISPECIES: hypothetical protein [Moorena]NEQ15197.1 hypothetical protein [Moorena sp. SIO3E2]NEP34789.1 hypothetical protein [Moorena sp. SIO3B2]NEP68443.1 hypothetical protein [Moorena sp. SIO3A5]NEQ06140.1 hypothetical protein [Moorena sp. SIO4E2]NER91047.1 hypothetical protein [Moorena sp. SIO3A2]